MQFCTYIILTKRGWTINFKSRRYLIGFQRNKLFSGNWTKYIFFIYFQASFRGPLRGNFGYIFNLFPRRFLWIKILQK